MGAILVLTPLLVSGWPAISAAVFGAASAMGYAVTSGATPPRTRAPRRKVESTIENSEVVSDIMGRGERLVIEKDGVTIEFGQDERGSCTICVTGDRHTDQELRKIGDEVARRVVQQFAYHKLMTELKRRNYSIVDEKVMQDESIQVRVRL